jgi:hypothetical protein
MVETCLWIPVVAITVGAVIGFGTKPATTIVAARMQKAASTTRLEGCRL